jgi:hypothetical protein
VSACVDLCVALYHARPACRAASWNGPSKMCYLKTGKANPHHKPGDVSFVLTF